METLCGIDRIYRYLQCVEKEQEELSKLPREMVVQCLTEVCPE